MDYKKMELTVYKETLSRLKKTRIYQLIFTSLCFINAIIYTYLATTKDDTSIMNIILPSIWWFCFCVNLYTSKKSNKFINDTQEKHDKVLKDVDYPKYISQQRRKKLKKLKKIF